jgi:hypothetical protein
VLAQNHHPQNYDIGHCGSRDADGELAQAAAQQRPPVSTPAVTR